MKLHYSIAADGSTGIGYTAQKQIEGAEAAGLQVVKASLGSEGMGDLEGLPGVLKDNLFDVFSALKMDKHDVFHGWSQHSLFQMLLSKNLSDVITLQRSSHHILKQREILEKEYTELGVEGEPVPDFAVRKELLEYEVADKIVVPSESCKESFDRYGLGGKTVPIGFGVNTERFQPESSDEDGFKLLFLGGNIVRKGLVYAIDAWSNVDVEGEFLVGGRESIPFPCPSDVVATGWIEDVKNLYREADALILPSLEEGQALVVWEALASGLPVIVSERAGFNEVIEEGEQGFIVEPRDVDALSEAIDALANDEELRIEMGGKARELAERNPWSKHQENLTRVWRN